MNPKLLYEDARRGFEDVASQFPKLAPYLRRTPIRVSSANIVAGISKDGVMLVGRFWNKCIEGVRLRRMFVVLHEMGHVMGRYWERVGNRCRFLFNLAQDLVINHAILDEPYFADLREKDQEFVKRMFTKYTLERILSNIEDAPESPDEECWEYWVPDDIEYWAAEGVYNFLKNLPDSAIDKLKKMYSRMKFVIGGSASDGERRPWEEPYPTKDTLANPENMDKARRESRRIERSIAARGTGRTASELFGRLLRPDRPRWVNHLRIAMRRTIEGSRGFDIEALDPLNRRSHLLPEDRIPRRPKLRYRPRLGIVVDTSGSISDTDLHLMGSQLLGIARHFKVQVKAAFCSMGVTDYKEIRRPNDLALAKMERGGTDLVPAIQLLDKDPKVPSIVVFTDGWTPWPESIPRKPVYVVKFGCPANMFPDWVKGVFEYWDNRSN